MLTRFVRIQLIIFTVAAVVGMAIMVFGYLGAPALLGVGQMNVTLQLPRSGGLYHFSNVTYRGVQVGKVTKVAVLDRDHVEATLSLDSSFRIPADLTAAVRSMSAVGEQYVDLQPHNDSPPYLRDGSVITMGNTTTPQQVGPMLDQVSALVHSIPKDRLNDLLNESFKAFNGAGYDVGSLLDSSSTLTKGLNGASDQTRALVDDSGPLLDGQAQSTDNLRILARSLAGVTGQITQDDPKLREVLQRGPGTFDEVSRLLTAVKPTLPVLLANLTTIGQVAVTYHASLEQLLVLLPPSIATTQASSAPNNPTGLPLGDFELSIGDPPACNVGFLPPSQWRSPADLTDIDTPDGLYCKLPQDSPLSVRGARNYPCIGQPGKRAPTVQICESDKPYEPLALHAHATGPTPFDPNLIAQGIPPDSRIDPSENIYGPLEGTPLPAQMVPETAAASPIPSPDPAPPQPDSSAGSTSLPATGSATPPDGGAADAAPSAFSSAGPSPGPSVTVVHYNRQTGEYMGPDGHMYRQADLASAGGRPKSWTDLVMGAT